MMLRTALSVWGSEDSDSEGRTPCPQRGAEATTVQLPSVSRSNGLISTGAQGVALHLCEDGRGSLVKGAGTSSVALLPPPADFPGCDPCWPPGNAAVVLRSRLKVRVVKEPRGKKVAVPNGISENGVLAAGLDVEVGKQAVQYQVCGPAPPPTRCRALPSGRGCRAGALGWTS